MVSFFKLLRQFEISNCPKHPCASIFEKKASNFIQLEQAISEILSVH